MKARVVRRRMKGRNPATTATIAAPSSSTSAASVGLNQNIAGRMTSSTMPSSAVPNSWPVRKLRSRQISLTSRVTTPVGVRSK